ncbi:MAG: hypothetical protein J6Q72_01635 [Clostridia bacterium]|nr:hypothetical protein [Clostridia bacterium]
MEKAKRYYTRMLERLSLCTKNEKRWFLAAFSLLSLYFCFVIHSQLFLSAAKLEAGFISLLLPAAIVAFSLCVFLSPLKIASFAERGKPSSLLFGVAVAVTAFCIFFSWQRALYPGSFSPDSIEQYKQALSGEYNDWHPALHTWLFFSFPMLFSESPAIIVTFQLIWFALALGYLYYVMYSEGCPLPFLAFSFVFITANPNTALIMLYPWKDSAFTILATVCFAHLIRIYRSNGEWLFKIQNVIVFAFFCFLATSVRHNAVLLTLPLFAVVFVFFKNARKKTALAFGLFLAMLLVLRLPIYSLAGVDSPKHRTTETMGLPMTLLADVYMNDREAMSDDALRFMDSLATQENWEKHYSFGGFNSFKWSDGTIYDKIDQEGAVKILGYAFESANASPEIAKRSVLTLTKMVWSMDYGNGWSIGYGISGNDIGIKKEYDAESVERINAYRSAVGGSSLKYLFNFIGVIISCLLVASVSKIGRGGIKRFFAIIPLLIYNFGTMLLLTGHDFRFFHLNFVLAVPLIFILFSCLREKDGCFKSYSKTGGPIC